MANRESMSIDLSTYVNKWQRIDDVKGMWYTE